MDRTELLNAMRVIKDHCSSLGVEECVNCEIKPECIKNFCKAEMKLPDEWELGDGESNETDRSV